MLILFYYARTSMYLIPVVSLYYSDICIGKFQVSGSLPLERIPGVGRTGASGKGAFGYTGIGVSVLSKSGFTVQRSTSCCCS